MTPSFETFAAIRYGYGLSQDGAGPGDVAAMLAALTGPDRAAAAYPVRSFRSWADETLALGLLRKARRANEAGAEEAFKAANRSALLAYGREMGTLIGRAISTSDAFRERLVWFWADHFSVSNKGKGLNYLVTSYWEEAIRPNVTGNFRDLLRAADLHPAMLVYLDQVLSFGPNSKIGKQTGRGLNENLAREILELHTLGVGSAYSQDDVRQFAELLTGLGFDLRNGFKYRPGAAEPGPETLLGRDYGGKREDLAYIEAAFDDIARHPDTARHLARKLTTHFIADNPDPDLVAHVAAAYLAADCDLVATYAAMLEHPAAWAGFGAKAKQPYEYLVSSLRALSVPPEQLVELSAREARLYLAAPMLAMGQPWQRPSGPDGWPEAQEDWITPQGLAARIEWALLAVSRLGGEQAPQEFARTALGEVADETLLQMVGRAESRLEGTVLVLASPEFNRR